MNDIPNTDYITSNNTKKGETHYMIRKRVHGKLYTFGTYHTLEEAIYYRDYFQENGWEDSIEERDKYNTHQPSYIRQNEYGYYIQKNINGVTTYFGGFRSYEAAVAEVEALKRYDWDYDLLIESEGI